MAQPPMPTFKLEPATPSLIGGQTQPNIDVSSPEPDLESDVCQEDGPVTSVAPLKERCHRKKLVLCFDGTGNAFKGNEGDSNILKIFRMLDRTKGDQCKL